MQLLRLFFFGFLDVRRAVLLLEPLDAASRIHESLLAGVERVAHRAGFRVDGVGRAARLKRVAAAAVDHDLVVLWMDLILHGYDSQTVPKQCILPKQAGFSTEFFCDFMSAVAKERVFEIFLEIVSTSASPDSPL
jgi:hypothetical protein